MIWFCFGDGLRVTVCILCLFAFNGRVKPRPLPEDGGTVTQTGEPSHFQVDDKAAEIEVNANPAGVKVNAKPASLQVVAKPGAPAIPIFHPSIHLAQHYAPPPVIHHHPAMFYHGGYHLPFGPFGHNWFYNGIKRQRFPRPGKDETEVRTHKSDIPRTREHKRGSKSRKRQFISAVPKFVQPSSLASLGALSAYRAYGFGALPQYALFGSGLGAYGSRQRPQAAGLYALPSRLTPQQSLQESGLSRSLLPSQSPTKGEDTSDILGGYQRLYSELNGLASLYNSLLRQRSLSSLQDLQYSSGLVAPRVNTEGSGLGFGTSDLGAAQYGGAMMGYGRAYIPSPLAQLYSAQNTLPQTNGLLGASLIGQQPLSRYVDLSSLLQRSPMVGRSKVPGASHKKVKKHHQPEHLKEKRKVKRQTLVEPILAAEDPSSVDDLLQGDMSQNYKRQLVLTPALETLQQLQPLQPVLTQQSLQTQPLQLRQLQLQQQLLQDQPLTRQSLGMQPVDIGQQVGMQPTGMQQQLSMAGTQQLGNILSLDSTPLRYMTSSLVSPVSNLGSSLASRSSPAISQPMVSPLAPSLMPSSISPSSLMSPMISNAFSRPRNDLNSFQSLSSRGLLQDRSFFRHPLRLGYPSYTRHILHRPQYRRRLHDFREEELGGIKPEVIGHEGVTMEGSYSTEDVPGSEGETLINSPVGFGPITVEAKTAEGARAAQAAGEDKRYHIDKPSGRKHTRTRKENPST